MHLMADLYAPFSHPPPPAAPNSPACREKINIISRCRRGEKETGGGRRGILISPLCRGTSGRDAARRPAQISQFTFCNDLDDASDLIESPLLET